MERCFFLLMSANIVPNTFYINIQQTLAQIHTIQGTLRTTSSNFWFLIKTDPVALSGYAYIYFADAFLAEKTELRNFPTTQLIKFVMSKPKRTQ